jgi:hypothetical protein
LDAVRGSLSADRGAERTAETDSCFVSVEELIRVLLQQTGHAEEANSSRGDVISRELEGSKHSAAVEERPSDVADAFDSNAIGKASEMGCRRFIEGTNEVGAFI